MRFREPRSGGLVVAIACAAVLVTTAQHHLAGQQPASGEQEGFRFRSGVELVNVTATVTDASGHFVPDLQKDDFILYEDGKAQNITHFSSDRVPISLGIALDTSGSMAGDKIVAARQALDRFLYDLLDPEDEIFMYRFSNEPFLVQDWTTNRDLLSRSIGRVVPNGGTAMYDAVSEAVPMAAEGHNRKKALLVVSDGNDTNSTIDVSSLKQLIRETEVLVYAIGIDGRSTPTVNAPRFPLPLPFPFPIPGRRGPGRWPLPPSTGGGGNYPSSGNDRVNVEALREMTDDSGGRTEIIRSARDLDPATANVAAELSKQYFIGYPGSAAKDGRWHTIRVEVRRAGYHVRARRGYIAS